ncbi:MAG: hypothetical protein GX115_07365 [Ruminiclostridium sp.]|nr:hypothetical protein [Ruminiclostridium sp.]
MYLTFMLRALGYSDTACEFSWDAPDVLEKAVGILPEGVDTANFLRSDVVLVSWASLEAGLKGGGQTLSNKLMEEGVFKKEDYGKAIDFVNEPKSEVFTAYNYDALIYALYDNTWKVIEVDPGDPMFIPGEHTIPEGITVSAQAGTSVNGCVPPISSASASLPSVRIIITIASTRVGALSRSKSLSDTPLNNPSFFSAAAFVSASLMSSA